MPSNQNIARKGKNDEFYTQFNDIQNEVLHYIDYNPDVFRGKTVLLPCDDPEWSNFTKFFALKFDSLGLRKLISTSYNPGGQGKVFTIEPKHSHLQRTGIENLQCQSLAGDGDFRSSEVSALRDAADIVITNPPFSLFRQFLAWINEAQKDFLILGNQAAVTYKETFPLIQANKMWLGPSISSGDREFQVPDSYPLTATNWRIDDSGNRFIRVTGVRWFTNLDHGRRHQPLTLITTDYNLRFNKKLSSAVAYKSYDNYDAIEVPQTKAIPSDYEGTMGVPITFLDKYCPEQFEIVGISANGLCPQSMKLAHHKRSHNEPWIQGKALYQRIFIRSAHSTAAAA